MTDLFDNLILFTSPTMQAVGAVLILCVLLAAAFYLVASFRDYTVQDQETDTDVLANLREMHRKGDISDQEFRRIEAITERSSQSDQFFDRSDSPDETASPKSSDD